MKPVIGKIELEIVKYQFRESVFNKAVLQVCVKTEFYDTNTGQQDRVKDVWRDATIEEANHFMNKYMKLKNPVWGLLENLPKKEESK